MKKIYKINIENDFQSLIYDNSINKDIFYRINHETIIDDWIEIDLDFKDIENKDLPKPDITFIFGITGMIAMPLNKKELLFPNPCKNLEFLPMRVEGEKWVGMHCLYATDKYDPARSKFSRTCSDTLTPESQAALMEMLTQSLKGNLASDALDQWATGKIILIEKLVISSDIFENNEIFTIDGSNRATHFCLPSFVERFNNLHFRGLKFKEIGTWETPTGA